MNQNQRSSSGAAGNRSSGPDLKVIGIVLAALVVIVVITVAVVGVGDDDDTVTADGGDGGASTEFGVVSTSGGALPPLPDGGQDPAVGAQAPQIVSERPSGTVTVEPSEAGTPTMIVFLAHWCPHCQAELPRLVEMADDGAFEGIRTVAVLTASDPNSPNFPPSEWLDEEGWEGDRFFDDRDGTAAAAYGLTSFPFTVFVDAEGNVVDRFAGEQPEERITAAVDAALG